MNKRRDAENSSRLLTVRSMPASDEESEKLRARPGVLLERTQEARSLHGGILFLHATHHHAEVLRFDHNGYASWMKRLHQRIRDLNREVLLDLESAREHVDDARDLGETNHLSVGNVSDMRFAHERQKMMLAHRVELDVLDEHDLTRLRIENRVVN